ncbi:hypothetical protein B6N60_00958 [Richelia sinica FACHB-800]|uniref:Uncharacterized protein n=1 Tax=Richelia sinica FACHB-800 TaxID=1357546 RepID=A0A975Y3L9_9NOST|nr:hypothetical protein B6N60_00958 [Richelia sinica FACHB-800]
MKSKNQSQQIFLNLSEFAWRCLEKYLINNNKSLKMLEINRFLACLTN